MLMHLSEKHLEIKATLHALPRLEGTWSTRMKLLLATTARPLGWKLIPEFLCHG